ERGALSNRCQLCGLQVRVAECRKISPLFGESGECAQNIQNATTQQVESAPHQDQIGVVGDVSARCTKVNERLGGGSDLSESVDVRHYVVPESLLVSGDSIEIDVIQIGAHLANRLVGDRNTQLALRLGEREPDPAPH